MATPSIKTHKVSGVELKTVSPKGLDRQRFITQSPYSHPSFKLGMIINGLRSSATMVVGEEKKPVTVFEPSLLALGRSVIGNWKCKFRTSRSSTVNSGTGTLQVVLSTDLASQSEGAALTALFDECKLLSTELQILGNAAGAPAIMVVVGFEPIVSTTTPTTALVARLPGSIVISSSNFDGKAKTVRYVVLTPRNWGLTSDEGVSTPRIASGMNGNWSFASMNTFTTPGNSYPYFGYHLRVDAMFRNRG